MYSIILFCIYYVFMNIWCKRTIDYFFRHFLCILKLWMQAVNIYICANFAKFVLKIFKSIFFLNEITNILILYNFSTMHEI